MDFRKWSPVGCLIFMYSCFIVARIHNLSITMYFKEWRLTLVTGEPIPKFSWCTSKSGNPLLALMNLYVLDINWCSSPNMGLPYWLLLRDMNVRTGMWRNMLINKHPLILSCSQNPLVWFCYQAVYGKQKYFFLDFLNCWLFCIENDYCCKIAVFVDFWHWTIFW